MSRRNEEVFRLSSIIWIVSLLRRHFLSYSMMLISAIGISVVMNHISPQYFSSAVIYLKSSEDSDFLTRLGKLSGQYSNSYKQNDDADKYLKLLYSQSFYKYITQILKKEDLANGIERDENYYAKEARHYTSATQFKKIDYDRIKIISSAPTPKEALNIVRRIAVFSKEAIVSLELQEIEESKNYLKKEMKNSKIRLRALSKEIDKFRSSKGTIMFSLSDNSSPLKASISKLRSELEITEVRLVRNKYLISQFTSQIDNLRNTASIGGLSASKDLLSSRGRLADVINSVKQEVNGLKANKMALQSRLSILQSDLSPDYEQRIYEFKKQIELEYSFYELLQQNLFQTGIHSISVRNKVRSLDLPSAGATYQKLPLGYKILFAMLIATLTTIVLIAMIEYFYPVVTSRKDLVELGLSYLSHIPRLSFLGRLTPQFWIGHSREKVIQVCSQNTESQAGISFRFLRVRFLQLIAKSPEIKKVFAIGSSRPNEGKSFVSVNFAISLSAVGKKVLLIDADERVASLSKLLSDLTGNGLVQYCKNTVELDSIINRNIYPNLDFIPVGYQENDEFTDILSSGKLKGICDKYRDEYDLIIVDTPAFHAGADALLIYEVADSPILVLEAGKTSLAEAHNVIEMLKTLGHEKIYSVLNKYSEFFEIKTQNYYYQVRPAGRNGKRDSA